MVALSRSSIGGQVEAQKAGAVGHNQEIPVRLSQVAAALRPLLLVTRTWFMRFQSRLVGSAYHQAIHPAGSKVLPDLPPSPPNGGRLGGFPRLWQRKDECTLSHSSLQRKPALLHRARNPGVLSSTASHGSTVSSKTFEYIYERYL